MVEKSAPAPMDVDASRLEWIKIKDELSSTYGESVVDKFSRKSKANPFVPIGCVATVGCLVMGLYSMKKGDSVLSQKMMRFRIGAQAFTVVALMAGVLMTTMSDSK